MAALSDRGIAFILAGCIGLAASAHAQDAQAAGGSGAAVVVTQPGYVLAAEDQIQVTLYGEPPTVVQTRIKSDGTIVMPQVGTVLAAGFTADALGTKLAADLRRGGYYVNPQVNVEITGYASKIVTVLGHVGTPGIFPLDRPQSVAMMVARAGGVRSDGANVVVLSHEGAGQGERIPLIDQAGQGGARRMLQPGDMLVIPAAERAYIYGEVKSPGPLALMPDMTFRQAVASAGGPTLAGTASGFSVRRGGRRLKPNLDDPVLPEDVIFIRERFF